MDLDEVLEQYAHGRRDFHEIDLSETDLSGLNLSGINLRGANLSESDLISTNLSRSDLGGANLSQADLSNANLISADLSDANLFLAKLHGSRINKMTKLDSKWALVWKIVNKDAEKKNLSSVDLSGANLSNANLKFVNLSSADLCHANLSGANLSGANLSNANLECADLSDADLSNANLREVKLINTNLTGANLENIDLSNVYIDNSFMSTHDIFFWEKHFYERFEIYLQLFPEFSIIERLKRKNDSIEVLTWRELERLVSELLVHESYQVALGKGSKDEGVDVLAVKEIENVGFFKSVWQVKQSQKGKKVGIDVIRQLADTRNELKASKGIIVTNSFLTREALNRIERDKSILGKVDGNDLKRWVEKIIMGRT
jgi:uncharacterized protein YjbI with pentapeptide repeats